MKATLILRNRVQLDENGFVELVIWRVPKPLAGSDHGYKYRLALVRQNVCVMRYDNEAGKGDHRHVGEVETAYRFRNLEQLQRDFWDDVEQWSEP